MVKIFFFCFQLDVELLSDVFENFRLMFHKECNLDIAQFLSIPSVSFAAMLKESKVKLELISDINQFLLIEKNLRGGYCGAHRRISLANHSKIPFASILDPTVIIMSQDFASLYAYCMTKWLPTSVRWGTEVETNHVKALFEDTLGRSYMSLTGEENVGFLIYCDISYPDQVKGFLSK